MSVSINKVSFRTYLVNNKPVQVDAKGNWLMDHTKFVFEEIKAFGDYFNALTPIDRIN